MVAAGKMGGEYSIRYFSSKVVEDWCESAKP